ncbi:MAG: AAA family ATPase [Deltaproteobacteria bacterium]|nr:AAA family ATPase [Deltaproteobacteria bacterium]
MYVRKIRIRNARQIRDLTLELATGDEPRMLTVLLGQNGTGKTTLLRSIAATLAGSNVTNKLCTADEIRSIGANGPLELTAEVTLAEGSAASRAYGVQGTNDHATWSLDGGESGAFFGYREQRQGRLAMLGAPELDDIRNASLPGWFVAGYGVNRSLPAPMASVSTTLPILGQLGSLFDSVDHGRLVATNFADILKDTKGFARALRTVLQQPGLMPGFQSLELRGRNGVTTAASLVESRRFQIGADRQASKVPASWLSHGYQSVIALVADVIGRAALAEGAGSVIDPAELRGVLLIDEVDLHLHPGWQRSVVPALSKAFPRLQIIASTHSPMVIADLRPEQVVVLEMDDERGVLASQQGEPGEPPQLLTAAQLLSTYFGVQSSRAGELRGKLRQLRDLLAMAGDETTATRTRGQPSKKQQGQIDALRNELLAAGIAEDRWTEASS